MKKTRFKDVKEIHHIKNIEKYLNEIFGFVLYERGDNTQIYELWLNQYSRITVEIISDESLIENESVLSDLITQDNIGFFNWSIWDEINGGDREVESYSYRPLVNAKEKDFTWMNKL